MELGSSAFGLRRFQQTALPTAPFQRLCVIGTGQLDRTLGLMYYQLDLPDRRPL